MLPGSKLGPYEIIEPIGRGGMGEVYRAYDARLRRNVAIKTVASGALADPAMRDRFDREARAVAALSHPNILAIYDVGDYDGLPYVAVELLEGDTLRPHLGTSPLPLSTALDYAVQIGRGLAAAHDRGIVHRDLKPENIFVTRDRQVKLLDFGLATEPPGVLGDEATRLARTEAGLVLGTAGYMSPEQARGEHADVRSDIFSFGCVLYEMLAARRAFANTSRIETLHAVLKEHPPDLTGLRSDVSQSLNRVVRRCLEKAPEGRFQTARDLGRCGYARAGRLLRVAVSARDQHAVHRLTLRLLACAGRVPSARSGSKRRMSPGWHASASQMASSVEKRIARAFPVLRIDRLARVIPI